MATPQQQPQPAQDVPRLAGQLQALAREGAKDINSTLQEVFFGKQAGPNELGTPLAPTQRDVNNDLAPKMSLDDMRRHAAEKEQEANKEMDGPSLGRGR